MCGVGRGGGRAGEQRCSGSYLMQGMLQLMGCLFLWHFSCAVRQYHQLELEGLMFSWKEGKKEEWIYHKRREEEEGPFIFIFLPACRTIASSLWATVEGPIKSWPGGGTKIHRLVEATSHPRSDGLQLNSSKS